MPCLDDEVLQEVAEGRRAIDDEVELHLGTCSECRRALAAATHGLAAAAGADPCASAPPTDEPSWDELGAGVVLDRRYLIGRCLGAGAMGVVWSATRLQDGQAFALKIARSTDLDFRKRFAREAQVAVALRHPHVVATFEVIASTDTRGPCLVQEMLVGETLEARLQRDATLRLAEAARVVMPIASALSAAHARGIVHRDLKPQNVFLETSRVVVLDFGIAKLTADWGPHSKLTRSGAVLGTPRYMAPEQLMGEPLVDGRADVWALGALLFRTLGGRTHARGETLGAAIRAVEAGDLLDLATLTPGLPEAVYELVRAALTVDRGRRLADVARFVEVLAPFALD